MARHVTVLAAEAVESLAPRAGGVYVDGTFGGGGHTRALAERIRPDGRVICIDRDPDARHAFLSLEAAFPDMLTFVTGTFAEMASYAASLGYDRVDGVLLDLGFSSLQIDDPARGFAFRADSPLDMRYDRTRGASATELLATADEAELTRILFAYGEERKSRRIARAIVRERERRPIATTAQLSALVEAAVGGRRGAGIHPATRTFQALRIAVNDELSEVERGVRAGLELLAPAGRFAVIAFHSLEDRVVKRAFTDAARGCVCPRDVPVCVCGHTATHRLVDRPIRPTEVEVVFNPRARSAIMRVAERLP